MMVRTLFIILICCIGIVSCKSPEARRPIQASSGSFIKESAERNKKIYEEEKAIIQKFMDATSENSYITSESGFWYFYNTKLDSTSTQTPQFGDEITRKFYEFWRYKNRSLTLKMKEPPT